MNFIVCHMLYVTVEYITLAYKRPRILITILSHYIIITYLSYLQAFLYNFTEAYLVNSRSVFIID